MTTDPAFNDRLAELTLQSQMMWGGAAATLCLLLYIAFRFRGQLPEAELRGDRNLRAMLRHFHESSSAIASMEFLMVFFPFLIIVMVVWQLAFMFNAQIHVGYAAYAAARSASVIIPEDLQDEPEYQLKQDTAGQKKWSRVRRAALPGLIGISPGNAVDAAGVKTAHIAWKVAENNGSTNGVYMGTLPSLNSPPRLALLAIHRPSAFNVKRAQRSAIKNAYAESATEVLINGKNHTADADFSGVDTIAVTVKYPFFLNVPFVGRLIESTMKGWTNPLTGKLLTLNPFPSMELSETIHMKLWLRKRTIDPC